MHIIGEEARSILHWRTKNFVCLSIWRSLHLVIGPVHGSSVHMHHHPTPNRDPYYASYFKTQLLGKCRWWSENFKLVDLNTFSSQLIAKQTHTTVRPFLLLYLYFIIGQAGAKACNIDMGCTSSTAFSNVIGTEEKIVVPLNDKQKEILQEMWKDVDRSKVEISSIMFLR